ncbi:MAG: zinc transporter ZupT [Bacillota bacterium]|nr:zinc transporter ZupT [Bacillota bacterium]
MDLTTTDFLRAFLMTLIAGLATGVGGLIAVRKRQLDQRFLSIALGFSAGVMIYVSFMEMLPKAQEALVQHYGDGSGPWVTVIAFFVGIGLIALIDNLIPEAENPHEPKDWDDMAPDAQKQQQEQQHEHKKQAMLRMGLFSALAIAIHNFPEGFATFMSALEDPALGLSITVAIAIHNIPEGISVAVPVYYATDSRRRALRYAVLSGVAEPLGAIVGFLLLRPWLDARLLGLVFAAVAGIMVYISLDELLPSAEKYGRHHHAILGVVSGMAVMALSLLII